MSRQVRWVGAGGGGGWWLVGGGWWSGCGDRVVDGGTKNWLGARSLIIAVWNIQEDYHRTYRPLNVVFSQL